MNVLVIGYGSMGKRHAANARALGHEVRVYDTDLTRIPDAQFSLTSEIWKPDAVVVATPASSHWRYLTDFPLRTPPVRTFVEKPLGDASPIPAIPDDAPITVGYNLRYLPGMGAVRHTLRHRLPHPVMATLTVACDRSTWPGQQYGDTLLELSHEIDLALHLLGPARLEHASATPDRRGWLLALRHASGCLTGIRLHDAYKGYQRGGEIVSADGWFRWTWTGDKGGDAGLTAEHSWGGMLRQPSSVEDSYRAELAGFLAGSAPPACTFVEGLAALGICLEAAARQE